MVKSYLKFEHLKTFGQVCSATSNALWISDETVPGAINTSGSGRAVVAAGEDVLVWEIKTGELLSRWTVTDNHVQVTVMVRSQTDPDVFAVGYEDGRIRLWDLRTATVVLAFNGHKSAITCLAFDDSGIKLASGARDTDIIVWDLVTEVGKFRLRGHKDQITSLSFLRAPYVREDGLNGTARSTGALAPGSENETDGFLLSTSKDALIKVWDLSSQHCMETHVAQSNGECWALGLSPDHSGCITAGNDGELRAWTIDGEALSAADGSRTVLKDRGSFYRNGKDRTIEVTFHPRKDYIALHGSEKAIELWRIRSETEIQKSLARKRKRKREKMEEVDGDTEMADAESKSVDISTALITEVFVPYLIVRTGGRVRSMDWAGGKSGKAISILAATTNNQIEMYTADADSKKKLKSSEQPDYTRTLSVDMPGHRTDIRCVALSSDDRMLATASHGSLKIWNVRTTSCIRTLDCGYALSIAFLPGDRAVIIGTKEGTLELFDIASSTNLDTISAHEKDVWSLHVQADGKSLVTGSADKSAKFWDFRVVQEEILGTTRKQPKLTLIHIRTLKLSDDVLCLRFSPDARLLAVSDLSNTVKVFFTDTLKPYLTLYGHKLPILSLSISYDSKLIVTSSADKNIRIWGLDHGDCHRALFAHQDSILSVAFMPNNSEGNGHHFFSASKDRTIKYFDADKFEQIQKLEGHHGEIWALAVANSGEFLVSASHDKSIRIWQQGDEQVFPEEEREKEMEELYEGTLVKGLEVDDQDGEEDVEGKVLEAGKQTVETLMAGEKIQEALEVGMEDLELMRQHAAAQAANPNAKMAPSQRNLLFTAAGDVSASVYVLRVFQKIPAASLQDALLVLSFSQLPALFTFLAIWASEGRNITLVCRVLFFVLKVHQKQLVSSRLMRVELERVRECVRATLRRQKDELGFNLAGLRILGRRVGELGQSGFVDGEIDEEDADGGMARSGRKRAFVNVA